jgi:hypothetical protein
MSSQAIRIVAAAVIGLAVGLLIAATEWLFLSHSVEISTGVFYGYGLLFTDFVRPILTPLLWPARLLIPAAAASKDAAFLAIAGNALLYAAAAAVADRIYADGDRNSDRTRP